MEVEPGRYRHYKGNEYDVVCIGLDEDTQQRLVVYRALSKSGDFEAGTIWIRPLSSFLEKVDVGGKAVPRFTKL